MTPGGFSTVRLTRLRSLLQQQVDVGLTSGAVVVLARHDDVHIEEVGVLAFEGPGATRPMASDTICRLGSMSKPLVAACAMTLVEDLTLRLDEPVDEFLPELAKMQVLTDPHAELNDTVAAQRSITLRDLLTYTLGTGMVLAEPGTSPIAEALDAIERMRADEWISRIGALPLVHQPGERWMYHTAADITGVLIARATGVSFGQALHERICEPLGMTDTGFSVSDDRVDRFSTAYAHDPNTGALRIDDFSHGTFRPEPIFESGGGGLVSSANDFLAFAAALRKGGAHNGARILSRPAVTLMTTDHLTLQQKAVSGFWPGYFDDIGWGFGMSVRTRQMGLGPSVGSYGWRGYFGTAWENDPAEDLSVIVMMQHLHGGDLARPVWKDFWPAVYQAIDD